MSNLTDCVDRGTILIQNRAVRDSVELRGFECGTVSESMCPEACSNGYNIQPEKKKNKCH